MAWQWLIPAGISAGANILSKILGGKEYERGLIPEQKNWLANLQGMWDQGLTPAMESRISAPFVQARKGLRQRYARQPGISGIQSAQEEKLASAQAGALSEATSNWKMNLARIISSILGGAYTAKEEVPWGDVIGQSAGDIGLLYGLEKILGQGGGGAGGAGTAMLQYAPGFLGGSKTANKWGF